MHYAPRVASQNDAPKAAGEPTSGDPADRIEPDDRIEPADIIEAGPKRLDLSVWNAAEAVRGAANRQLSGNLLEAAVQRLRNMGLLGALAFVVYLGWLAVLGKAQLGSVFDTALSVSIAGILLSLALFGVTKLPKIPAHNVADLGNVYLFAVSLALGILRHSQASTDSDLLRQVSPVVIPLLAFGALIPTVPSRALSVMLVAAAMDPLGLLMMRAHPLQRA